MKLRFARSIRAALAATAFAGLAVACSSESPRGDASFANAAGADRTAAIELGLGAPIAYAAVAPFAAQLDHEEYGCPQLEEREGTIGYIGDGCETPEGSVYEGAMWLTNVPSFADLFEPTIDPSKPMKLVFDNFSMDRAGTRLVLDGQIHQSSPDPDGPYTADVDLAGTINGASFALVASSDCETFVEGGQQCDYVPGATGSMDGIGSFGISGHIVNDEGRRGWLALSAIDELYVDFDAAVDNCAPYTINDSPAGSYCYDPGDGQTEDPFQIYVVGEAWYESDTEKTLTLTAYLSAEAESVAVEITGAGATETHQLSFDRYDAEWQHYEWKVTLRRGGNTSVLDGDGLVHYKVTAVAAGGASDCETDDWKDSPFAGDCPTE